MDLLNRNQRKIHPTSTLVVAVLVALTVGVTGASIVEGVRGGETDSQSTPVSRAVESAPAPGSIEAVAEELSRGQALERAEITADLADAAEVAHEHLAHTLQDLAIAVPIDDAVSEPTSTDDVEEWKGDVKLAMTAFEGVKEGTSDQSVAHEAFIGASDLLLAAIDDYAQSLSSSAGDRETLIVSVRERRDGAVRLWQAGAAQLDTLSIESGGDHRHVFLAVNGDPDAVPLEFHDTEH